MFDIILERGLLKEVRSRQGKRVPMADKDLKIAESFVRKYYKNIVEKSPLRTYIGECCLIKGKQATTAKSFELLEYIFRRSR